MSPVSSGMVVAPMPGWFLPSVCCKLCTVAGHGCPPDLLPMPQQRPAGCVGTCVGNLFAPCPSAHLLVVTLHVVAQVPNHPVGQCDMAVSPAKSCSPWQHLHGDTSRLPKTAPSESERVQGWYRNRRSQAPPDVTSCCSSARGLLRPGGVCMTYGQAGGSTWVHLHRRAQGMQP